MAVKVLDPPLQLILENRSDALRGQVVDGRGSQERGRERNLAVGQIFRPGNGFDRRHDGMRRDQVRSVTPGFRRRGDLTEEEVDVERRGQ